MKADEQVRSLRRVLWTLA